MAAVDMMEKMKAAAQAELDAAELAKIALAAKVKEVSDLEVAVDSEIKAAHDAGVIEGKAMIQLPDPSAPGVIYTQQQMSDAVKAGVKQATDSLQAQIDGLNTSLLSGAKVIEDLNAKVSDLSAKLDQAAKDLADEKAKSASLDAKVAAELGAVISEMTPAPVVAPVEPAPVAPIAP